MRWSYSVQHQCRFCDTVYFSLSWVGDVTWRHVHLCYFSFTNAGDLTRYRFQNLSLPRFNRHVPTQTRLTTITISFISRYRRLQFITHLMSLYCEFHGWFTGGPSRLSPPLGRRTDAVTILLTSENGTVLWRVLNFDRSVVKQLLQNTQSDCHQWVSDSSRMHQIRFRSGLRSGPRWEAYTALPRLPSWFKGPDF